MSEEFRWYVVHTYSGYENKVASNLKTTVENRHLEHLFADIKVPVETVTEMTDKKETVEDEYGSMVEKTVAVPKEVERKIFPGYVFIKMVHTDESWYVVRNIRGCTGFVGPSSEPVPLSDEEVEKMGVEIRTIEVSYEEGDSVRIIDGPFEDFVGTVGKIDKDSKKVSVTVSMFGRETPVELDLGQVEPLE